MNNTPCDNLLLQLSRFIADKTALHFPPERWHDLRRKISAAAQEFGYGDQSAFVQWLLSTPLSVGQLEILASHLTIAETYFWREPQVFQALAEDILPALIRARGPGERRLRFWSAGCATGEEPYSIAMALHRVLPPREGWQTTILATDINPRILRRAQAGVYSPWSFRNAPAWLKRDYFRVRADGLFELNPEIRDMVTFAYLNLADDLYPSVLNSTNAMDVIFCRNVLMYFLPERIQQVVAGLFRSLVEGGWLMVSACELSAQTFAQFTAVNFPEAIVYRKEARWPRPVPPPAAAPLRSPLDLGTQPWPTAPAPPQVPSPAASPTPLPARSIPALSDTSVGPLPLEGGASEVASPPCARAADANPVAIRELANQGQLGQALALCEQAMAANRLDPALHFLRAAILEEQNLAREAISSLRRALYLDPNLMVAHFSLGNLLLRQGNLRAAQKSFANVLGLLEANPREEVLPQAEGLTVGRFREIVEATIRAGGLA